jgi:hydroxyacylglutathione hydrolase
MLRLLQLPARSDNYIWLLANDAGAALVVDPADPEPVLDALAREQLTLKTILNTHHHHDHVGGNERLVDATGCEVVGAAHDKARIPRIARMATVGGTIDALGLTFRVLDVRAHTSGHICYALDTPVDEVVRWGHDGQAAPVDRLGGRPVLFVGDSLFIGGCGRLFEGTPEQLHASMAVYRAESPDALVCCAHEYTGSNLKFGCHVLPSHAPLKARLDALDEERGATRSSVPDTLARELETNVFLLALDDNLRPTLASATGADASDPVAIVGALRAAKDGF